MYLTPANFAFYLLAGAGTGVLGAILGTGGGVFLIPLLVLVFGVEMHFAVATSIVTVVATSCAVASANVERGTANMRLGMTLEIATSLGAIAGGLSVARMNPQILEALFALVLVPTAIMMWRGRTERAAPSLPLPLGEGRGEGHSGAAASASAAPGSAGKSPGAAPQRDESLGALGQRYFDPQLGHHVAYHVKNLPGGLGISFIAGILSGMLGIGGGVFKVPALHLLCGMPIKAAAATSNFMIGVTATASAFLYFGRGEVRPAMTAAIVLGVLSGSVIGSLVNQKIGGKAINRTFAVLLACVAVQMMVRVWWK
jgi:uncharacterized membrane protein YfcA